VAPGREYREPCQQTATRISELADQNRADVAQWATTATAEFRKRNEAIGVVVSAKSEAMQQECANARQAIQEAAKSVQREAEALGLKRKQ
jgi:gas vesicle protein